MKTAPAVILSGCLMLGAHSAPAAAPPATAYAPLAFLVGHCWKGTFPDSTVTDEHCFSWVYGDKFVRDRHVVHHGGARADDLGESIYLWDDSRKQLQYLYIESAGGFSQGSVTSAGAALVFPPAHYTQNGIERTYRSRWRRTGETSYEVITEIEAQGAWTPGFRVRMERAAAAAP